jgi:hypothetical protein
VARLDRAAGHEVTVTPGKDGNIYFVLSGGDFTGVGGDVIAIPFRLLKHWKSLEDIVQKALS